MVDMETTQMKADFSIENHGSLMLFRLHSKAAISFVNENVSEDAQYFGNALVVEPRFAENLAQGMLDAGLAVR